MLKENMKRHTRNNEGRSKEKHIKQQQIALKQTLSKVNKIEYHTQNNPFKHDNSQRNSKGFKIGHINKKDNDPININIDY